MSTRKLKDYVAMAEFVPAMIHKARPNDLKSQLFLIDMETAHDKWGEDMLISPAQIKWLIDLSI